MLSLAEHVNPRKFVMTWYRPHGTVADYTADAFPIFIREADDLHIFGIPTLDGRSVKVAPDSTCGDVPVADQLGETSRRASWTRSTRPSRT